MIKRNAIVAAAAAALAACSEQPVSREGGGPLPVVPIATQPYLGLWHEAARLPNRFERDCARATAEYELHADGLIRVRNTCFRADGVSRDVVGRARRLDDHLGKLKVSFFGPFWADYWVLQRAEDYSWSIVGEPSGRYLWVLTRAPNVTAEERVSFERRLAALGYDTSALIWNTPAAESQ